MKKALLPAGWIKPRGYASGVAATGTQVFIAGQIGWDEQAQFQTDDFAGQAIQALRNVLAVLARSRRQTRASRANDVVRHRQTRVTSDSLKEIGRAFRELIGDYDIAMSARASRRVDRGREPRSRSKPPPSFPQ